MAGYFPLFVDIQGQNVAVFGGGVQALEKIRRLLPFSPRITVISPLFDPKIEQLAKEGSIQVICCGDVTKFEEILHTLRPYLVLVGDLEDAFCEHLHAVCVECGIPINVEDKTRFCTFMFPSLVKQGPLTVAISTSGASPAAAKKLREELEEQLPTRVEEILDWLGALRPTVRANTRINPQKRAALWRELVDRSFLLDRPLTAEEVGKICISYEN